VTTVTCNGNLAELILTVLMFLTELRSCCADVSYRTRCSLNFALAVLMFLTELAALITVLTFLTEIMLVVLMLFLDVPPTYDNSPSFHHCRPPTATPPSENGRTPTALHFIVD
jgi:hypothetical protein